LLPAHGCIDSAALKAGQPASQPASHSFPPCPYLDPPTWFEIMATRWAKRHVEMDSSMCCVSGATAAIMTVRQLPPRLSRSIWVSSELR
jgi:hypothetical protein